MRFLLVLYAAACTIWTLYMVRLQAVLLPQYPEATLRGAALCVLLLAVLPSLLGYVLLFKTFPWMGRFIRR